MEAPDRVPDRLERLVDGGDVGDQDGQFTDADLAVEHVGGTKAEHQCGAEGRRRGDAEREQRLLDRQLDPGVTAV